MQTSKVKNSAYLNSQNHNKNEQQKQIIYKFMNHCATVIQSHFKGHIQRKYYKKFLPIYRRLKQILYAGFLGWKARKVMKLSLVKNKINQIKQSSQVNQMQIRIKKRDLSDQLNRLLKNGAWLYYFHKENKFPLNNKSTNSSNNMPSQKLNLKSALMLIPKQKKKVTLKKQDQQTQLKGVSNSFQKKKNKQQEQISKRSRKGSKYEIPKQNNSKKNTQHINYKNFSQKHKFMSIQVAIQPELKQINKIVCQTPSQSQVKIKQFSFQSKQLQKSSKIDFQQQQIMIQSKNNQSEQSFKSIMLMNRSCRKGGLQMTLSKKFHQQFTLKQNNTCNQNGQNRINSRVLHQFTKKKHDQILEDKKYNIFDSRRSKNIPKFYDNSQQISIPISDSVLKFKTDEFQRKKLQHSEKVKNFKKPFVK